MFKEIFDDVKSKKPILEVTEIGDPKNVVFEKEFKVGKSVIRVIGGYEFYGNENKELVIHVRFGVYGEDGKFVSGGYIPVSIPKTFIKKENSTEEEVTYYKGKGHQIFDSEKEAEKFAKDFLKKLKVK